MKIGLIGGLFVVVVDVGDAICLSVRRTWVPDSPK